MMLLALIACFGPSSPPLEERVIRALRTALPDAQVTRTGPGQVEIRLGDDPPSQVNLTTLQIECERAPATCDDAIDFWVGALVEASRPPPPPQLANVRIALHGKRAIAGSPRSVDDTRPFVGDLVSILVEDTPTSIMDLNDERLALLGSREEVHEAALANMRRAFGTLRYTEIDAATGIYLLDTSTGGVVSDSYDASRLLFPELWKPIADQLPGDLIAAAPARDAVVFTSTATPKGPEALAYLATAMFDNEPHPVSTQQVRWTPEGWVPYP